jgi:hypothetical protein
MNFLPGFFKTAAIRFCRDRFAVPSVSRRINFPSHGKPVSLHMVVGKEMSLLGMLGLRSLEWHTGCSWAPFIHDDGTLDEGDVTSWKTHFPDCTVIMKPQADETVGAALASFPSCRENRLKHHWFLKVFDTHYYATREHYIVIDSDILFFRRPKLFMDWLNAPSGSFYVMEDTQEKYSHPRKAIEEALGVKMLGKVNSGLDLIPKHQFSLELAEKFLSSCAGNASHYEFLEQTIFAIMASHAPDGRQLPREYEISWNRLRRRSAVCRHYVGPVKKDLFFLEGATSFHFQTLFQKWMASRR